MKLANANKIRRETLEKIIGYFSELGEDCGQIASNSFNFPIAEDGEEGWVEIVVKIPKSKEDDDGDEGYSKREEYKLKLKDKAEKEEKRKKEKEKKIAKDKKLREEKKKIKE